jgi:hypothetical protein
MADEHSEEQMAQMRMDRIVATDIALGILVTGYTIWLIIAIFRHFTN